MTDATLIDGKAFSEKLVERVAERAARSLALFWLPVTTRWTQSTTCSSTNSPHSL